jgi:F-type H+-transporting ATPase subunit a
MVDRFFLLDFLLENFNNSIVFFIPFLVLLLISRVKFSFFPNRIQSMLELINEFLESQIKELFQNNKDYLRWMPFLLALFFYILISNIIGLVPGVHPITGNIWVTGSLAVMVIAISIIMGIKRKGFIGFFADLTPSEVSLPIRFMIFPIEIISFLSKIVSLAVRLYANIFAGHLIVKVVLSLIVTFQSFFVIPLDLVFVTIMLCFEILVSFIQAFIFVYLSAVYLTESMYKAH